jgi:hypothetical protein
MKNKPASAKKIIYIVLTMILGAEVSVLVYVELEILYLRYLVVNNLPLINHDLFGYGYFLLPTSIFVVILLLGIIGGFLLGRCWWHMLYEQKKHWLWKNWGKR